MDRRELIIGTGAFALGAGGITALASKAAEAANLTLVAQPARFAINGAVTENMMSYAPDQPPPVIRMKQGRRFVTDLINKLPEETTIHWHGVRVPNPMDGVPYLAQDPIPPGTAFRYDFVPMDAGTYWYHPHCNTLEQMGRGLTGVLIVDETIDPGFDTDLILNLRDFRLGPGNQFIEFFTVKTAARGGTLGTVMTANWAVRPVYDQPAGGLTRLRLVASDTTRVYKITIPGAETRLLALDGNPVPDDLQPLDPASPLFLGPGQRADIAVRIPDLEGSLIDVLTEVQGQGKVLAQLKAAGPSRNRAITDVRPLPSNPVKEPDIQSAERHDFVFGWTPGGDKPQLSLCGSLGFTFWSINRAAWPGDFPNPTEPLAIFKQDQSYILSFRNETQNDHPIHLHGMTFRVLHSSKRPLSRQLTDTVLLRAQETIDVAVVADNPGNWMFHCHVIEHQKSGLSGFIRVA